MSERLYISIDFVLLRVIGNPEWYGDWLSMNGKWFRVFDARYMRWLMAAHEKSVKAGSKKAESGKEIIDRLMAIAESEWLFTREEVSLAQEIGWYDGFPSEINRLFPEEN